MVLILSGKMSQKIGVKELKKTDAKANFKFDILVFPWAVLIGLSKRQKLL